MSIIKPIEFDIMSIRTNRQNENNMLAHLSIKKKDLKVSLIFLSVIAPFPGFYKFIPGKRIEDILRCCLS